MREDKKVSWSNFSFLLSSDFDRNFWRTVYIPAESGIRVNISSLLILLLREARNHEAERYYEVYRHYHHYGIIFQDEKPVILYIRNTRVGNLFSILSKGELLNYLVNNLIGF